ncbi:MAG: von Willebrand factor type A domain-containing protein [Anaerolineae bacterium]|nr:von Willebrand factor type A domain-containing protein [Anaerolineae bacterium]
MMNRKAFGFWTVMLVLVLLGGVLLTACGGDDDEKDSGDDQSAQTGAINEQQSALSATAPALMEMDAEDAESGAEDMLYAAPPPEQAVALGGDDGNGATGQAVGGEPGDQPALGATPVPQGTPDTMFFEDYGVNPFLDTEDDHLSTFAMDVDSASYTLARAYLRDRGLLPPPEAIRPEEMINYFDVGYEGPEGGDAGDNAFAIHLMAAPAPFGYDDHYLFRVGLQGRYIAPEDRDPALLIFVIDVSGSMQREDRLELLKDALELLVDQLREDDRVGIVVYSDQSRAILEPTSAANADRIMDGINRLQPEGSTNVADGMLLGYAMAQEYKRDGELTRVIVLSDGVGNVGPTGPDEILAMVRDGTEDGITLSTIGFGMGNYNDETMERLANDGNGNYFYVDNIREARRVFVHNMTGTLQVIGYDAKVQVDFNPDVTDRYRLIGYENRAIADEDFRDDTVDAGEVGAGHSITALYELALEGEDVSGVVATVYIRYQDAETREVVELSQEITVADLLASLDDAPADFRLHAAVAEFAELLRESYWAEDGDYMGVYELAEPLVDEMDGNVEVEEFVDLVRMAGRYVDQ